MAHRSPRQVALRGRIERVIGLAAPFLDVVLLVGDRVSRAAGRGQVDPDPPRRLGDRARTPIGGPPTGGLNP